MPLKRPHIGINAMKKESEILVEAGASCIDHAILLVLEESSEPLGPSEISRKLGIPTAPDAGVGKNGKKVRPAGMNSAIVAGFLDRLSRASKIQRNEQDDEKWEMAD